jgi:hypothetical protein
MAPTPDAKGHPLSHLRFTPDEYRTLSELCARQALNRRHQPAFHRLLVASLRRADPALADRIARLSRDKVNLLYWHFRGQTPAAPAPPAQFTSQELRLVAEACVKVPFPVRFVRPFKEMLVELFEEELPALARKLAGLSGQQFERLYAQVVCR